VDDPARFEHLLADLSTRFAGVPAERVDGQIDRALELLVGFLGTDRGTFLELLPEAGEVVVTHSWARPGVTTAARSMPVRARFPWYHERLRRGETLCFERLPDELPAEAVAERSYAVGLPMLSHVAVPLRVGGRRVCALLTATARRYRSWTEVDVGRVRMAGQILADAVYRRRLERELRESLDEVRSLQRHLEAGNEHRREAIESHAGFERIAGRSAALREVLEQAAQVAPTDAAVLLLGETGTGKELLASAIHARSRRREGPLIKVNCAAIPPSLIESELFGHEKGAFTGATSAKPGRFELADGATLFLDEVGEIPLDVQVKLLRFLEDGEFQRLGAIRPRKLDVRLVAATNRNLELAIAKGGFREDLYYRLSVFPIQLPPLRDRREDVPLLVWDLIHRRQDELGRRIERVPESGMRALGRYSWPGNVRELGNVIERAIILSRSPELCLDAFLASQRALPGSSERLDDVERVHLQKVLERCRWRINGPGNAAEALGMHPSTLRSRLKKLGVARPPAARGA
jgi:transcriptional regulator with GAF, ATPase, and Fis domain